MRHWSEHRTSNVEGIRRYRSADSIMHIPELLLYSSQKVVSINWSKNRPYSSALDPNEMHPPNPRDPSRNRSALVMTEIIRTRRYHMPPECHVLNTSGYCVVLTDLLPSSESNRG